MTHLDGNAAAGDLRTIFAVDVTAATGQCANCEQTAPLGTALLYNQAPGMVARCAGCDSVLLRLVTAPGRAWLDVRGLTYLQLQTD
jgi:Family of unknown function (DUF6510)